MTDLTVPIRSSDLLSYIMGSDQTAIPEVGVCLNFRTLLVNAGWRCMLKRATISVHDSWELSDYQQGLLLVFMYTHTIGGHSAPQLRYSQLLLSRILP